MAPTYDTGTVLDLPLPHPQWCALHDHEADVCLGDILGLDFTAPDHPGWLLSGIDVQLGFCPEEGVDVSISIPGCGGHSMGVDNAAELGYALLALVATARRGSGQNTSLIRSPR